MKKALIVILSLSLSVPLFGCNSDTKTQQSNNQIKEVSNTQSKIEISQEAINLTIDTLKQNETVIDAAVIVKGNKINMVAQVGQEIPDEEAKEIGDNFIRILSSNVASFNENVKGPSKDEYGDLYKQFDVQIGVGTGTDNFIVQGAKVRTAKTIKW